MELYVPPFLPSLPRHLFLLILTACCGSLFPCSLCLDTQYEYCQKTSKCGNINITYPFGVGNRGCGLPSFQISCVQNANPVITIEGQSYTILASYRSPILFTIVRGEKCNFLDVPRPPPDKIHGVLITSKENRTLNVYRCDTQVQIKDSEMLTGKCNASAYYALYDYGHPIPGCSSSGQVIVAVDVMKPDFSHNMTDKSCTTCEASGGICGYYTSDSTAPFVCYCKDGPHSHECPGHGRGNKSAIMIGCSFAGVALLAVLSLAYYLKNRKPPPSGGLPRHLPGREMGNLPIFSYEELCQSTNCFHEDNELGVGGFGSVYLGKLGDGRIVAVKRLYQDNSRRLEQFINEVKIFSTLNHPHVVRLYGCTPADSPELLLVYEFVPNGTLADHLHGYRKNPNGLPWNTRLNIAIQTAQALVFLHSLDPPIIHRDVKSSNILLDENLDVKLADFGLCRLVPVDASHVTTIPQGTPGYVDPEYYQCYQLTEKSDVYSFGVILVEIISAKLAMDINRNKREINLANLAMTKIQEGALHELVDPQLDFQVNHEVTMMVSTVAELAFRCLASERDDRPHMNEVVGQLEEIRHSYRPHMNEVVGQLEEIRHSCGASCGILTARGQPEWGSFSNIKQPNKVPLSPISVQDKWLSSNSTPDISE